ncbi:hypothetical protein Golax_022889, partial [Gossypium laxum]|nr:hypothetical protein [Gossypium laxum]
MRNKRNRARGSCGELTEESPSRTIRRKLLDGLSPLKAGAGRTNEVPMLELSWDGEPCDNSLVRHENNKNVRFTGFYGNANPNLRSTSWDILRRVGGLVREDWVVGGDFNAILNDAEKYGGR